MKRLREYAKSERNIFEKRTRELKRRNEVIVLVRSFRVEQKLMLAFQTVPASNLPKKVKES